jgi:hypothetical protein
VSDFLGVGLATILGTLGGLLAAVLLNWLVPNLADAVVLYALLVATGFIVGLVLDNRSKRR